MMSTRRWSMACGGPLRAIPAPVPVVTARAPLSFSPASQVLPGCANVLVAPKNSTGICAVRERPRG
jgi:hypothetical protein